MISSLLRKKGVELPWDVVDDYPSYEAAVDNINFRDYVKLNCPRNVEQILKCKLQGVGCAFQMKLVLSKNDQTVRLFDLFERTNNDAWD